MIPLFELFPLLRAKLPYRALGEFPTPVEQLVRLGGTIGVEQLYIKRDDLSAKIYGGNKVRKLEFLLGHALQTKAKEVLTFGFAGSNHALATAIYAQQVGLKSISMLMPQPNAYYLRRNLLMSYYCGAELHQHRNVPLVALGSLYQLLRHKLKYGSFPNVIAAGGSSPLGVIGFVNAAFELKNQISRGELPEPDRVYVALGTTGTAVGLLLGLKAANLKSRVIPVRVADVQFANARKMVKLFRATNSFLSALDPAFPHVELAEREINIRHEFFGPQYALFTREGMDAVHRMMQTEGIKLDGTYTGKALAALIHDVENQDVKNEVLLFWNTYNARDLSDYVTAVDYHHLPRSFHRYFEEEVQPLDSEF
jgi:1-aminocyclopropane-1-carboxylate deaminase/D-cysteine desulfhydrase-like pyridoxal-dependent ACC family enzyme